MIAPPPAVAETRAIATTEGTSPPREADPGIVDRLAALEVRVEAMASRMGADQATAARALDDVARELAIDRDNTNERVAALDERVETLEEREPALPPKPPPTPKGDTDRTVVEMRRVDARLAAIEDALGRVNRRLAAQDQRITSLDEAAAAMVTMLAGAE